mmetsp:Transcript_15681/g.48601  ORF Transcript_15681/g.48601 Transcript_15681/m.48601 type:complete len:204 (-) Transcript_15681:442-1053(-)
MYDSELQCAVWCVALAKPRDRQATSALNPLPLLAHTVPHGVASSGRVSRMPRRAKLGPTCAVSSLYCHELPGAPVSVHRRPTAAEATQPKRGSSSYVQLFKLAPGGVEGGHVIDVTCMGVLSGTLTDVKTDGPLKTNSGSVRARSKPSVPQRVRAMLPKALRLHMVPHVPAALGSRNTTPLRTPSTAPPAWVPLRSSMRHFSL